MSIRLGHSPAPANAVALALVAIAAGCGNAQRDSSSTPPSRGEALFVHSCGACHRLAVAGTEGVAAKSLDETKPSVELVLRTLAAPPKNMPRSLLSGSDAKLVAAYVAANAGR